MSFIFFLLWDIMEIQCAFDAWPVSIQTRHIPRAPELQAVLVLCLVRLSPHSSALRPSVAPYCPTFWNQLRITVICVSASLSSTKSFNGI